MNRLFKEINRLLIGMGMGMWSIYLKVPIEKKWQAQNVDFKKLTISSLGQGLQLAQISLDLQIFCCNLKKKERLGVAVVLIFFEKNHGFSKSKSLWFLLNKNIKINKNDTESKMEDLKHSFLRQCFSSYNNC